MTGDLKRTAARTALAAQAEADDGWDTLMAFADLDEVEARARAEQQAGAQVIDLEAWRNCAEAAANLSPYWRRVAMTALVRSREQEQRQLAADCQRLEEEIRERDAWLWGNAGLPHEEVRARAEADVVGRYALRAAKVLACLGPLLRTKSLRIRYRDDIPPEDCPPPGARPAEPSVARPGPPQSSRPRKLPPFEWSSVVPLPPPPRPLPPGWRMPHPLDLPEAP